MYIQYVSKKVPINGPFNGAPFHTNGARTGPEWGAHGARTGLSISARSVYLPVPVLPHVSPPVFISALNFITRAQFHTCGRVEIKQENRQSNLAGY